MSGLETLRELIGRHAHNSHGASAIEGLMVTATDAPTAPLAAIAEPSLGLVIAGRKRTMSGDRVFDYAAGEFLVSQLDLPVVGQVTAASAERPFLGIGLRLKPSEIAAILLESTITHGGTSARAPGIGVAGADAPLLDALARLAGLLDAPRNVPVLAPLYRREVLWRLMTGPQGAVVRQIGLADGNLAPITRTVQWIRDHHDDSIRIGQLAALAGMSESTFHRHFRAVTRMTPIQYQKAVRLQQARLALVSGGRDVAEVAHAVGYDSASQFSREYRRLFGAPPGQDAQRIRAAESVPVP
ncbi:MAG TPA: AraC family transcriptional regulator [Trebonia sp.]|nr:AraC family transcriptional regulator [Trebonia sp.]